MYGSDTSPWRSNRTRVGMVDGAPPWCGRLACISFYAGEPPAPRGIALPAGVVFAGGEQIRLDREQVTRLHGPVRQVAGRRLAVQELVEELGEQRDVIFRRIGERLRHAGQAERRQPAVPERQFLGGAG